MGWDGIDLIDLAQNRDQWRALVDTVMNLRVPQNAGKFLSNSKIRGFSRGAQLHEIIYFYELLWRIQLHERAL
jgi:hypothetical protein